MSRSPRRGVSLINVFVVLTILVILVGLLLPANRRVRTASARSTCINNLGMLMKALHNYEVTGGPPVSPSPGGPDSTADPAFPPGCMGPGASPEERLSWLVGLLPYLEQDGLSNRFDAERGYAANRLAAETTIKMLLCPAETDAAKTGAVTHYVAMAGLGADAPGRQAGAVGNGFMGFDRRTSLASITDGAANTIALMETRTGVGPWARGGTGTVRGFDPADTPLIGDGRPFGGHSGIMIGALADGSVRAVTGSIDPRTLAAAVTIAGGDVLGAEW